VWVLLVLLLVCGPFILGFFVRTNTPIADVLGDKCYRIKYILLFVVCSLAITAFLLRLIWLEWRANPARTNPMARVESLIELARELRACLLGLGMLLTFAILSQATLRVALIEYGQAHPAQNEENKDKPVNALTGGGASKKEPITLPQVLSWSLYYSFVILVAYTPFHIRLVANARGVVEEIYPLDAPPHDVLRQRDDTLRLIGLSGDWPEALRSGVIVFSPLLATIMALALPHPH
jgi:hypothetical protein